MITFNCSTPNTLKLNQLTQFQGNLKKRTDKDIQALSDSILNEGLLMPFAVWKSEDKNYLLDGHGRFQALVKLSLNDPSILEQELPCLFITAKTEEEAKKALLQITSQYGRITKQGAISFCGSIPEYKAPSINKFVHSQVKRRKLAKLEAGEDEQIIKIAVKRSYVEKTLDVFKDMTYIRIL